MTPLAAAKLAADLKVKVYTIGAVGNRFCKTRVSRRGEDDSVDEPMMQKIAESTGGKYFRATDTNGLTSIYEEIDNLEKSQLEQTVRVSYREWFVAAMVPAIVLLVLEQLLAATRLLRVP